jgi:hypothetical protein
MVVPLLLHGQREKTVTTKRMGYSKEVSKDDPQSIALSPEVSTNIIVMPTMLPPLSLMLCTIPAVNEAEGYDDETSESNIVVKIDEAPYHHCLMLPSIPHIVTCAATRTNGININTHQKKGNINAGIVGGLLLTRTMRTTTAVAQTMVPWLISCPPLAHATTTVVVAAQRMLPWHHRSSLPCLLVQPWKWWQCR